MDKVIPWIKVKLLRAFLTGELKPPSYYEEIDNGFIEHKRGFGWTALCSSRNGRSTKPVQLVALWCYRCADSHNIDNLAFYRGTFRCPNCRLVLCELNVGLHIDELGAEVI
jgi:hypothetical protein